MAHNNEWMKVYLRSPAVIYRDLCDRKKAWVKSQKAIVFFFSGLRLKFVTTLLPRKKNKTDFNLQSETEKSLAALYLVNMILVEWYWRYFYSKHRVQGVMVYYRGVKTTNIVFSMLPQASDNLTSIEIGHIRKHFTDYLYK